MRGSNSWGRHSLCGLAILGCLWAGVAQAQLKPGNKLAGVERKLPGLSSAVSKEIVAVMALLEPEAGSMVAANPRQALQRLQQLAQRKNLSVIDQVNIHHVTAFAYLELKHYRKALRSLEAMLLHNTSMPAKTEINVRLMMANLYDRLEQPDLAMQHLTDWAAYASEISPERLYQAGKLSFQLDDYRNSKLNLDAGIQSLLAQGQLPPETWYQLQKAVCLELNDNAGALKAVENLKTHYPSAKYDAQYRNLQARIKASQR